MVAGAPLLAGGPPGWVLYGLLGIGTAIAAVVVYEAAHDADTTFPQTAPSCVQSCPQQSRATTQSDAETRVDPVPVPRPTCATQHPEIVLCSMLPVWYTYAGIAAAFRFLQLSMRESVLRLEKTRPADRGPCPGTGTHTSVRSAGEYVASIVCCPCCTDTAAGPVLSTKCGIV